MFTVNSPGSPGKSRDPVHVHGTKIAGVNDVWLESFQFPEDPPVRRQMITGRLVALDYLDIFSLDSSPELRSKRECYDRMSITVRGQPIDQVYQAVFHAAEIQAVNDVDNMTRCTHDTICRSLLRRS